MSARPTAMAAALAFVLVAAAAIAFGAARGTLDVFTVLLSLWVLVGALIVALRPDNAVGWLFGSAGVIWVTGLATTEAVATFDGPALTLVSWYGEWFWVAGFVLMVASLFLIPTGRNTSPAWRRVLWAFSAAGAVAVVLAGLQETVQTAKSAPVVDNPIGSRRARRRVGEARAAPRALRGDCRDRIHGRPLPPRQRGRARTTQARRGLRRRDGDLRFRRGRLRRQSRRLDLLDPGVSGSFPPGALSQSSATGSSTSTGSSRERSCTGR